ncbi:MAG TPA: hypothetical protein VI278_11910 [Nitrososphaeraceae archaeon]
MLNEIGSISVAENEERKNEEEELDPWMLYLYSIKSPATKEKYLLRLGKFLDYLNFQGALEDKARAFARKGKVDSIWAFNSILKFIQFQKERYNRKDITAGTIRNYVEYQIVLRDVRYCHKLGQNY